MKRRSALLPIRAGQSGGQLPSAVDAGNTMNHYPIQQQQVAATSGSYDSSSVSSTASPLDRAHSSMNFAHIPIPNRASSNKSPVQTHHRLTASMYGPRESGSVSPNEQALSRGEVPSNDGSGIRNGTPRQESPATMQNHKRAYRQRRKDPSCDACRERKVKVRCCFFYKTCHQLICPSVTPQTPLAVLNALAEMCVVNSRKKRTGACRPSSKSNTIS